MNYREKIRKAIECPQLNNTRYGEWGALTLEQRKYIKRLLDELDSADNYVKKLYLENQKQKEVIDKVTKELFALKDKIYKPERREKNFEIQKKISSIIKILNDKEVSE